MGWVQKHFSKTDPDLEVHQNGKDFLELLHTCLRLKLPGLDLEAVVAIFTEVAASVKSVDAAVSEEAKDSVEAVKAEEIAGVVEAIISEVAAGSIETVEAAPLIHPILRGMRRGFWFLFGQPAIYSHVLVINRFLNNIRRLKRRSPVKSHSRNNAGPKFKESVCEISRFILIPN